MALYLSFERLYGQRNLLCRCHGRYRLRSILCLGPCLILLVVGELRPYGRGVESMPLAGSKLRYSLGCRNLLLLLQLRGQRPDRVGSSPLLGCRNAAVIGLPGDSPATSKLPV